MRRSLFIVLGLIAIYAPPAHGDDVQGKPQKKPFRQTVRDVVVAYEGSDPVQIETALTVAIRSGYEPWFFVDTLIDGGHTKAAVDYAARVERQDAAALRSFASSGFDVSGHKARRGAVIKAYALQKRGKLEEALDVLAPQLDDAGDFASFRVSSTRGFILKSKRDRAGALLAFQEAQRRAEALGWTGGGIEMGFQVGSLADSLRRYDLAETTWRHVVELEKRRGDRKNLSNALHNLGRALRGGRKWQAALDAYDSATQIQSQLGLKALQGNTLIDVAIVYEKLADAERAISANEKAAGLLRASGSPSIVLALSNVANHYRMRGQYELARERLEAALPIAQARFRRMYGTVLITLGKIEMVTGQVREALARFQAAREAGQAARRAEIVADALKSEGVAYHRLGRIPDAFRTLGEAIDFARKRKIVLVEAAALISRGALHTDMGDTERARIDHERALAITSPDKSLHEHLSALKALAGIEARSGQREQALKRLQRVVRLATSAGYTRDAAGATMNIGVWHLDAKDGLAARTWFDKALAFEEALGQGEFYIRALINRSSADRMNGDLESAMAYASKAIAAADDAQIDMRLISALSTRAYLLLQREQYTACLADARRAVAVIQRVTGRLSDVASSRARARRFRPYAIGLQAAVELDDHEAVFEFLEESRSRSLLAGLSNRQEIQSALLPPELRALDQRARTKEAEALKAYHRARQIGARRATRRARKALREARSELSAAIETVRREAKSAAQIVYPESAKLADVRAVLQEDEALVSYGFGAEDLLIAYVVTKEHSHVVRTGTWPSLDSLMQQAFPGEPPYVEPASAQQLAAALSDRVVFPAKVKRVLVSTQGELGLMPFSLVYAKRTVVNVPSGSVLRWLRTSDKPKGEGVLAVGDPVYLKDPRGLASLPGTRTEAQAVGTTVLLGERATVKAFWGALAERPRWRAVHLACHGILDEQHPMLSRLALSRTADHDGSLRALEIFQRRIGADLAVLSACDTARGKAYRVEGVLGLSRAFLQSGAPRVISALWKVDDAATQALMKKFYERWNKRDLESGPRSAAAALKDAQQYVRRQAKWSHPEYWAAWVLRGLP